jgi:hypothetical protein
MNASNFTFLAEGGLMPQESNESPYSVHPAVVLVQNWIAKLSEKTGKSLEDWIRLTKKSGPSSEKERVAWLKKIHKLGTNEAAWIAARAEGKAIENFDDPETYLKSAQGYVEAMYAGPKAALRPLYERLLQLGRGLGKDVRVSPCKTFVPLYRKHVFGQIKPTTLTRIDLGLALGRTKTPRRLIDTGGLAKGDRITHRIPIGSLADIDDDVKRWLRTAYHLDA